MYSFLNKFIMNLIEFIIKFIYLNKCITCKNIIESENILCEICWNDLELIHNPACKKCGKPLRINTFEEIICLRCIKDKPIYDMQKILFKYNSIARKLIHNFKYYDTLHYGKYFAKLMFFSYVNNLQFDIIVPAPMHKLRRIKRLYNQVDVLAKYLSRYCKKPVISNVLLKNKNTKQQSLLTKKQRKTNLNNSFYIKNKILIKDKIILLLDDVVTTGATIKLCTETLLKHGAKSIIVGVLSYV
ncbi:MAG: ComF family protein [Rickettsiales bacterium]